MVVLLLVLSGVGTAAAWSTGRLNTLVCGGPCGPEAVADPLALERSATVAPARPGEPVAGGLDPAAVAQAVDGPLGADALGGRVAISVVDPASGEEVLREGPDALVPASTTKVLTAAAALAALDPQRRFETTVERDGDRVVLVGGGDPYLAREPDEDDRVTRADVRTLAERTAAALREAGVEQVSVAYDASLFTGPAGSEGWEDSYLPDQVVTPITALWIDRGIRDGVRSSDPAREAAGAFAQGLQDEGVAVRGEIEEVAAPGTGPIARVEGPTVAQAVEAFTASSSNEASEVVARHVAIAEGEPATFEGAARAIASALAAADVPTDDLTLDDGSGLACSNRIDPTTLTTVLARAITGSDWSPLLAGLPVGGFSGTLEDRFDDDTSGGAGLVRAKTGTLTGVHSLAGYVLDARGVPMAFAVMVDDTEGIGPLDSQRSIDRVAAALAGCTCG